MWRRTRQIMVFVIGDRSETTCCKLWEQTPPAYKGYRSYSDFWEAYLLIFPVETHEYVDKGSGQTNHMELRYCTLRQYCARFVRKTLSFSKSDIMYETVTRLFIIRYNLSLITYPLP
jgi:insertion element IS1 protein InsB